MPRPNGSRSNHSIRRFEKFGRGFDRTAGLVATFWRSFTGDMALGELWDDFKADTQAGYSFYSEEVD